jgi:hypothetical protein
MSKSLRDVIGAAMGSKPLGVRGVQAHAITDVSVFDAYPSAGGSAHIYWGAGAGWECCCGLNQAWYWQYYSSAPNGSFVWQNGTLP